MKKILFITCTFFSFLALAQKVKYKDVFQMIATGQKEAAYPYLKILLKSDSSLPSANLQTALILYEKAKSFDVLKNNEAALQFCDSAALYLARAKRLINEKEIRKNDEYYLTYKNLPTITENRDSIFKRVQNDIESKSKDIIYYRGNIKRIYIYFSKSVENYNGALQIYRSINNKYITAKEMCLLSDDRLMEDLKKVTKTFDSSVAYINAYRKAIKEFPVQGYNQNYTIATIETYRIDGLTQTDFLSSAIVLWNYSEWSKAMTNQINTDIKKIRDQLFFYDQRYNKIVDKAQAASISQDTVMATKPDLKLYRLINKYDYNSLAIRILDYKQGKIDFLGNSMSKLNTIENTHIGNIEAKAAHMFNLTKKINVCDTLIEKLKMANISKNALKYANYISKSFADTVGLKTYIANEKLFVNHNKKESFLQYQLLMYGQLQKHNDTTLYKPFGNYQIPLFQSFDNSKSNVRTTFTKEDRKGNIFLSGSIVNGGAFVAKINGFKQVEWLKIIAPKVAGATEFATAIEPIDEGCAVIVNSKTGSAIRNTLVKFDKNGLEVSSKPLNGNAIARHIIYDEINDGFLVVYKGNNPYDYLEADEPVNITYFDAAGISKWSQTFNLYGTVAELSKIYEGYLLICNYVNFSTGANKLQSQAGKILAKTNILMLKINPSGEVKSSETITSSTPVYAIGSVKISSSNINILGFEADFVPGYIYQRADARNSKLHKTVNSNLEFVYY